MDLEASALAVGILVTLVWVVHITHVLVFAPHDGYDELSSEESESEEEEEEQDESVEVDECEGSEDESDEVVLPAEDDNNVKFVQVEDTVDSLRQDVDQVYEDDEVYEQ